jgi:hypothetical protein
MAQRKYTPAAKGKGFNAVTVSNANIQQMSAESNRIVEGMRARRDSDLENQRRILQDMESNAAYSERTRKRNFDIASTNLDTQRQQQQYNAEATQARIRQETELGAKIFDSIASFSATAAQKSQELRKKGIAEENALATEMGQANANNYTWEDLQYQLGKNEEENLRDQIDANLDVVEKQGDNSFFVSQQRYRNASSRTAYLEAVVRQKFKTDFQPFLENELNNPENTVTINGQAVPYSAVRGDPATLSGIISETFTKYAEANGLPTANQPFLKGVYQELNKVRDTYTSVALTTSISNSNEATIRTYKNSAFDNWSANAPKLFNVIYNIKGAEAAHQEMFNLATAMGPDGEFIVSDAEWMSMDVHFAKDPVTGQILKKGFKGSYAEDHRDRTLKIQNARETTRRSWNTNQRTTERNDYQAESSEWWQEYQNNPTPETLAAAEESFKDNQQGNPEWLTKAKAALDPLNAPYIQQLKTQAKDLQARGILTQSFVTEVFGYDPVLGNQLQKSLDEQNPLLKNEAYKEQRKTVGNYVKKPSVTAPFPKDSASSTKAARVLTREFDALVKKNAAAVGVAQASDDAAAEIEERIAKHSTDKEAKYYRDYNPLTGLYDFPNLGKDEKLTASEAAKEQAQQVQDALNDGRQQEIINKKYGVLTQTELETEIKNINKPGYVPNVKLFLASKGLSGGVLSLLNKQLVLAGMDPIEPPESLAQVGEYTPSAQKLLQRYLNANVTTRIHGYEGNKLGNEWNRHVSPAEYRDIIDTHSKTYDVPPALIAAGLEVESQWQTNKPSSAGAKGIAQFMDATAAQYGVDVNDPDSSIKGMAAYMKDLLSQFGDPILAAGAYNAGPGRMQEYVQNGVPLPAETVNHMRKVTKALYKYSGDPRLLQRPELIRQGMMPAGSVIPYQRDTLPSTGDHLDTRILVKSGPNKGQRIDPMSRPDLLSKVYIGDNADNAVPLTSFEVTSPYGDRIPPAPGASSFHAGIDSAIASGKKIFVKDGQGFYREKSANVVPITDDDGNTFEFEFYHTEK